MTLKDFLNQNCEELFESINDKHLFKAVFMAGGPGSGKSFVTKAMFNFNKWFASADNVMLLNSDVLFELGLVKKNLSKDIQKSNPTTYKIQMDIRERAKELTAKKGSAWLNGMNSIVVDGTGASYEKIKAQSDALRELGYDTYMVFVNTSLDIAKERNSKRERKLDTSVIEGLWQRVQNNIGKFQEYFGAENFTVVDCSTQYEKDSAEEKEFKDKLYKIGNKIISSPLKNPIGKEILKTLKETRGKYLSDLPSVESKPEIKT